MTSDEILAVVQEYFEQNKGSKIGLKLPRGWFGRPHDSHFKLTHCVSRPHKLILELDQTIYLIFTHPTHVESEKPSLSWMDIDELVISGFTRLVVDWHEEPDRKRDTEAYYAGEVRFMQSW